MARKRRKSKPKNPSTQNSTSNSTSGIVIAIEVALLMLYIGINVLYMDRVSEIISTGKFLLGLVVSICTITGLNIFNINKFLRKHSKRIVWLKYITLYKHHAIIPILLIINTWLISSMIYASSPILELGKSDQPIENNMLQVAEDKPNPNVDVLDGEYPDFNPANLLSTNDDEIAFTPPSINELYSNVIERGQPYRADNFSELQLLSMENKELIKDSINTCFQKKCGTGSQPTNEEINSNTEFTNYTEEANRLTELLEEIGMDEPTLLEIIKLRTKAYDIMRIKDLRKLLANDWERLGLYYYKVNKSAEDAYNSLLKSIEYRTEYLRMLNHEDVDFYWEIYRIGRAFSTISLISRLDNNYKLHASLIACCILELSSRNSNAEDSEKTLFYSSYYAGMENHKLLLSIPVLGDDAIKEICGVYISDGLKFYERSLEARNYKRQLFKQYEYIKQVVDIGLSYINSHEIHNCMSIDELKAVKKRCS
jgi:hypothetical protein